MADKKSDGEAKGGGKNKIVMIVVAVAVLGVGAKMTVLKTPPAEGAEATTTTMAGGDLVPVEPMSVNLADGHYLKVGVAIELVEGEDAKYFEKAGKPNKIRDLIITASAAKTMEELASPEGKEEFREMLDHGAHELYHESYHGLYFTEFVMQ
jgi:flagellar FliL protein